MSNQEEFNELENMNHLKEIKTEVILDELQSREEVQFYYVEADDKYFVDVEGPATVVVVYN